VERYQSLEKDGVDDAFLDGLIEKCKLLFLDEFEVRI
jgi:hypothetical protein